MIAIGKVNEVALPIPGSSTQATSLGEPRLSHDGIPDAITRVTEFAVNE
jgi:hypothetical protein